jgi:chromosome partitioning protein
MNEKSIAILGRKGGTGKSATSHLLCLGAFLSNVTAIYGLTDPERELRNQGRPYPAFDAREPDQLARLLEFASGNHEGWLIVDGGGNRPVWDREMAQLVSLTIIPFRASDEDVDMARKSMEEMPGALAWPCAWPTNPLAIEEAKKHIDRMSELFPGRVMLPAIPHVNSMSGLLAKQLDTASGPVRQAARRAFETLTDYFEALERMKGPEGTVTVKAAE